MELFSKLGRVVAITGHYGCGKTNFALNLAFLQKSNGIDVTLVDLDIVNPYFISSDFKELLNNSGISVVASTYAGSLVEIPAIPKEISAVIRGNTFVIIDVGGDDV